MSGTGTMSPTTGVFPPGSGVSTTPLQTGCISFKRSLEILMLDNKCGAYGMLSSEQCNAHWKAYQREGWLQKLRAAEAELKRDLGAHLCPEQVCDELHGMAETIRLNQAPIAYLGVQIYSDWSERSLTQDLATLDYFIDICDNELGSSSINDVQVAYPDAVTDVYTGLQYLQAPTISRLYGSCPGATDGYRLTWPACQLVHPNADEVQPTDTASLITEVKWRLSTVDADQAIEVVGECGCECCSTTPEISILDDIEGLVCIDNFCGCTRSQVRINYATAFGGCASMDPGLEEAIVLLALLKTAGTPVKPCGCDNTFTEYMMEIDPTARTEFAHKLAYGPTNAGMTIWRTISKYKERPNFNQPVISGGMLTGRKKTADKSRGRSYLRGY